MNKYLAKSDRKPMISFNLHRILHKCFGQQCSLESMRSRDVPDIHPVSAGYLTIRYYPDPVK